MAKAHSIDITNQRSRQLIAKDLTDFDLILVMDSSNYNNVIALATNEQKTKVKLILNYLYPNENRGVPDPYYEGGFEKVYRMLDKACKKVINSYI